MLYDKNVYDKSVSAIYTLISELLKKKMKKDLQHTMELFSQYCLENAVENEHILKILKCLQSISDLKKSERDSIHEILAQFNAWAMGRKGK